MEEPEDSVEEARYEGDELDATDEVLGASLCPAADAGRMTELESVAKLEPSEVGAAWDEAMSERKGRRGTRWGTRGLMTELDG